jgi:positive phototaxis protein PixI
VQTQSVSLAANRTLNPLGISHLKFELSPGVPAVLPMNYVQEAITVPVHQLTPIPNMPPCILGLMHRRSQVLWVVDLAKFLGSNHLDASTQHHDMVILRVGQTTFSGAVHRIEGMIWLAEEEVQPLSDILDPHFTNYLTGCVMQAQQPLFVLDVEAIVQSSVLQGHDS